MEPGSASTCSKDNGSAGCKISIVAGKDMCVGSAGCKISIVAGFMTYLHDFVSWTQKWQMFFFRITNVCYATLAA
jgi:hypothetical protein